MRYQSTQTSAQSSQNQLDGEIAKLYQHFLKGDIGSLEFSELVDELIGIDALINAPVEEMEICQAA